MSQALTTRTSERDAAKRAVDAAADDVSRVRSQWQADAERRTHEHRELQEQHKAALASLRDAEAAVRFGVVGFSCAAREFHAMGDVCARVCRLLR